VVLEPQIGRLIVAYTKVQLQQGAAKVSQEAASAAAGLASAAQAAAAEAAQLAHTAAAGANVGLRAGTHAARTWAAPRLESAADYTTSTAAPAVSEALTRKVAPRVSAALRSTARQVTPADVRRRRSVQSALGWTALSAAALAAAAAVATLVWRRYREAMAADTEPDTAPQSTGEASTGEASATGEATSGESAGDTPAGTAVPRPATSPW
jgi:hypothetical protein